MPLKNREKQSTYKKEYRKKNKEKLSQKRKEYCEKNKEHIKKYMKEYYQKNREKHKEIDKIRYVKNREKYKIRMKEYYQNNKEKIDQQNKEWAKNNPKKTLEMMRKHSAKRKRNLGYNPLNEKFPGSVGHHINQSDVVYIPEQLHMSISHSVLNDQNMEIINMEAMKYIGGDFRHI